MAANSGSLVQVLVQGGISSTAAAAIANALANANTPQRTVTGDISDRTPTEALRLIDRDGRLYQFANLDYSSESPYEKALRGNPGQYTAQIADHPYKDSQPTLPIPPLQQPRVAGGRFVVVENTVDGGSPLASVSINLVKNPGSHLRANQATNALEAVPLQFVSPQGLVTAVVSEGTDSTDIQLQVRGLTTRPVVLADGTSVEVEAWANGAAGTVFSSWAQTNVMSKTNSAELLQAIGAPSFSTGTWTPIFTAPTSPVVTYGPNRFGRWTKVGNLVTVSGWVSLATLTSAGSGDVQISGLPYPALGYDCGTVAYKTGWTNQGPDSVYTEPGSSSLVLTYHAATTIGYIPTANLKSDTNVIFSCSYTTSA